MFSLNREFSFAEAGGAVLDFGIVGHSEPFFGYADKGFVHFPVAVFIVENAYSVSSIRNVLKHKFWHRAVKLLDR